MIARRQYLCGLLLVTVLTLPPTAAGDQVFILSQTGVIQSLDLRTGLIQIGGRSYRLAPTLKVYAPNGREANPAILQQGRNIRFTTTSDSTVVSAIYIDQVD